jgi:hypothetical protein
MNKHEKEIAKAQLSSEEKTLKELQQVFKKARQDVQEKISELNSRTDMQNLQSIIYQKKYQQAILDQINEALVDLKSGQYKTVEEYLVESYDNGYIGMMYSLQSQGIPMIMPINDRDVVMALTTDSKLSSKYYQSNPLKGRLAENVDLLKQRVRSNLSRGIVSGKSWLDVAVDIAVGMNNPFDKAMHDAMRIVRTEGHRVNQQGFLDAGDVAKKKGADILKQWDATMDKKTRPWHQQADGQIVEWDDFFTVGGEKMKAPSVGGSARNVCNCRCQLLQRARWALDEDELKTLEERAKFFGLDKAESFEDYKQKYLKLPEKADSIGDIVGTGKWTEGIADFLGVTEDRIQLDELPSESQSMIFKSVQKSIDRFPQLKGHFNRITIDHSTDALAVSESLTGQIKVSQSFLDFDKLKKDYNYGIKLKWNPEGTNVESIFTHEIGHQIDGLLTKNRIGGGYIDKFGAYRTSKEIQKQLFDEFGITKALSEARKTYRSQGFSVRDLNHAVDFERRELLSKYSCEYASQDSSELFACLYAEYMDSPNPRPMAKRFGEILEGLMGELK